MSSVDAINISPPPQDEDFTEEWRDYFKRLHDTDLIAHLNLKYPLPYNTLEFNEEWIEYLRDLDNKLGTFDISIPTFDREWSFAWVQYNRSIFNRLKKSKIRDDEGFLDGIPDSINTRHVYLVPDIDPNGTGTFGGSSERTVHLVSDPTNYELTLTNLVGYPLEIEPDGNDTIDGVDKRGLAENLSVKIVGKDSSTWISKREPISGLSDTDWITAGSGESLTKSQITGWDGPQEDGGSNDDPVEWSNPGNITAEDGNTAGSGLGFTSTAQVSEILRAYNFNFNAHLPNSVIIKGVAFRVIFGFVDTEATYYQLIFSGVEARGQLHEYPDRELSAGEYIIIGSQGYLFKVNNLKRNDIAHSDFGFGIQADYSGGGSIEVDACQMKIYYLDASSNC